MHPNTVCPRCNNKDKQEWLSTINEWRYYCPLCNTRYNEQGIITNDPTTK